MKNELKVYFEDIPNMGDQLNIDIIKKCFGYDIVKETCLNAELSAIGSGLVGYTYGNNNLKGTIRKFVNGLFKPRVYIWGTGFINYGKGNEKFFKRNMVFAAVRGELSKKRVENILGHKLNIPTGDPGILASYLLDERPTVQYDMGIIPHFKEKQEVEFKNLAQKYDNSVIIDVTDSPVKVITEIAKCKVILSSSLHGLIISDSLGIPNHHIVVTNKLLGDGFKFDDYYSSYGLSHEFTIVNDSTFFELDKIINDYKITSKIVSEKKDELINAFPFPSLIKNDPYFKEENQK